MTRNPEWLLGVFLLLSLTPAPSFANDGGIAFGGSPRLLTGHKTVSMLRERVQMTIGTDTVHVDCQFVFQNHGPACTVRMGFPDQGRGTEDPDEEMDPTEMRKPPKGTFLSYISFVDGVRVPTQTIRADKPGNFWHAKVVRFGANQTRRVHDIYTLPVGGQIVAQNGSIQETYYIVHTGASWHGPIGRTEVDVMFTPGASPGPLVPVSQALLKDQEVVSLNWPKMRRGTVVYSGPGAPTLHGRTLIFVRTQWRPAYKDDVLLSFGFRAIK